MDVYGTVELAEHADALAKVMEDKTSDVYKTLLMCAHMLRLYGSIEQVYRKNLGGEFYEICSLVNKLFNKSHTG